jgi:hypothetical protein
MHAQPVDPDIAPGLIVDFDFFSTAEIDGDLLLQEWLPRIRVFSFADESGMVPESGRINAVNDLPLCWKN